MSTKNLSSRNFGNVVRKHTVALVTCDCFMHSQKVLELMSWRATQSNDKNKHCRRQPAAYGRRQSRDYTRRHRSQVVTQSFRLICHCYCYGLFYVACVCIYAWADEANHADLLIRWHSKPRCRRNSTLQPTAKYIKIHWSFWAKMPKSSNWSMISAMTKCSRDLAVFTLGRFAQHLASWLLFNARVWIAPRSPIHVFLSDTTATHIHSLYINVTQPNAVSLVVNCTQPWLEHVAL